MISAKDFHGSHGLGVYLRLLDAGNSERKQLINALIPKELGHYVPDANGDGFKIEPVRELVVSEGVEGTDLIQTEFFATIKEGAEPRQAMRNFLPTINLSKGTSLKVPKSTSGSYAEEVAELAEVPPSNAKYTPVTITMKKIGSRPEISDEMISDSMYGLIALEIRRAGARLENKFNRDSLLACLSASGINEHDCTGSNLGLPAIVGAKTEVANDNRMPTKLLICPDMEEQVILPLLPSSTSPGYQNVANTGQIGRILGMDVFETTVSTGNNSYPWEYNSDNDYGALAIDGDEFAVNVIRQDIQVKQFEDPIRQIQGGVVTMRYGTGILDATAGCRVKY